MSETLERFFECLAERFYSENNLSDVTYALAKASSQFMSFFMSKFFKFDFSDDVYEIEREQSSSSGRPDIVVTQKGRSYIIENKIYDRNYHFSQYYEGFKDKTSCARYGFIANYSVDPSIIEADFKKTEITNGELEEIKKRIKTWAEFIELLEKSIDQFLDDEKKLIHSYLEYVREVCEMEKLQKVGDLSNLPNLHNFNILVKYVIANANLSSDVQKAPYPAKTRECGDCWSGKYMALNRKGCTTLYPFMGIHYRRDEEMSQIYISFEQDWNNALYGALKNLKLASERFLLYVDKDEAAFELKMDIKNFSAQDLNSQKKVLETFLDEVVRAVIPFWK